MKQLPIIFSIFIVLLGFATLNAQSEADVTIVKKVSLSADQVWEQLRIMDNIDQLSSLVASVSWEGEHGVGGSRTCVAADGQGYFKENILGFSDAERSYTYAVVEGVPAKKMVNNFKVVDLGYQQAMIIWTSNFEFIPNPQMDAKQFKGFLESSVTEMIDNTILLSKKS